LPLVYEELRRLAAAKTAQEKPGRIRQMITLLHEAYLRLVDVEQAQHWNRRAQFLAGVTLDKVVEELAISRATIYRQGACARAILRLSLPDAERA
jgi:hypothetical protein